MSTVGRAHGLRSGPWLAAALGTSSLIAATDGLLLEITRGGFGNGFGGVLLDGAALRASYFALTGALGAIALLSLWLVILAVWRWLGRPPDRSLTVCLLAGVSAIGWTDLLSYQIHTIVGAVVTPGVVRELAGGTDDGNSATALINSFSTVSAVAWTILAGCGLLTVLVWWVVLRIAGARAVRRPGSAAPAPPPQLRTLLLSIGVLAIGCGLTLSHPSALAGRLRAALEYQPTAIGFRALTAWASDFDRDGSGWLSLPADPAPFDPAIHGYALDAPGNGVDENALAGDLPREVRAPSPVAPPAIPARRRPHLLVLYLESFRYDVLDLELDGRPVAPFLAALAREGASSSRMFVHSPYTARSRAQMFGGVLQPVAGQRTWIDDFQELGYEVAHFSGQDDSFSNSEPLLGVARADVFYDARSDTGRRTSRSVAPASLQVSWKTLRDRVDEFLAVRDPGPLFLYVNLVDTHYPYDHTELDAIVHDPPVTRSAIRSYNRTAVWQTYLNAVANVDEGARQIVERFQHAVGDAPHAVMVTGDHGQSFYETGFLGHGHELDRRQTQVPLIVSGLGGVWPEPIGAADLRGLLLGSLDDAAEHPSFRPDPAARLFQYMPNLERPDRIAWRSVDDALVYEFASGEAHREDGSPVAADDPELIGLVHAWEALRNETAER